MEIRRYIAYWNAAKNAFYAYYHFADMPDDVKRITTFAAQLLNESNTMHIDACKIADTNKLLHAVFATENTLRDNIETYLNEKNEAKHKEDPVVVAFRWLTLCEREIALLYTVMIARKVLDYYAYDSPYTHHYVAMHCRSLATYINTLTKQRLFLYENFSNYCDHLRNMRFPSLSFKNYDVDTMKKDLERFFLSHHVELEKMQAVLQDNCCDLETMKEMFSVSSDGPSSFKSQKEKGGAQKFLDIQSARAHAQYVSKALTSGLSKLQPGANHDAVKSKASASTVAAASKTSESTCSHGHSDRTESAGHSARESSTLAESESELSTKEWQEISLDYEPKQGAADTSMQAVDGEHQPSIARMLFPKTLDSKRRDGSGRKLSFPFSAPAPRLERRSSEERVVSSLKDLRDRKIYFDMVDSCPHRFFATMNTLVSATLKSQDAIRAHGEIFSQRVLTQLLGYLQLFLSWRGDCDALQQDILKENKANSVYQVFSVLSNQYDQKVQKKRIHQYLETWVRNGIPGEPKKKKAIVDSVVRDAANWSMFFEASRRYLKMKSERDRTFKLPSGRVYLGFFAMLVSTATLVSYVAMAAYASALTVGVSTAFIAQALVALLGVMFYKRALGKHESRYYSALLNTAFRRIPSAYQPFPSQHASVEKKSVKFQGQCSDASRSSGVSEVSCRSHEETVISNVDLKKSQYQCLQHMELEVQNDQNDDTDSDTSSVSSFSFRDESKAVAVGSEVKFSSQRCLQSAESNVDTSEDDETKSDMSSYSSSSSSREVVSRPRGGSKTTVSQHNGLQGVESQIVKYDSDSLASESFFVGEKSKTKLSPKSKGKQKMHSEDTVLSSCSQFQSNTSTGKGASCFSHQY